MTEPESSCSVSVFCHTALQAAGRAVACVYMREVAYVSPKNDGVEGRVQEVPAALTRAVRAPFPASERGS